MGAYESLLDQENRADETAEVKRIVSATFKNDLDRVSLELARERQDEIRKFQVGKSLLFKPAVWIGSINGAWAAITLAIFITTLITGYRVENEWTTKINFRTQWLTTAGPDDDDNWVTQESDGNTRSGDNLYISWYFFFFAALELLIWAVYIVGSYVGTQKWFFVTYINDIRKSDVSIAVHLRQMIYLAAGHALFVGLCGQRDWTGMLSVGALALVGGLFGVVSEADNSNEERLVKNRQNFDYGTHPVRWRTQRYAAVVCRVICDGFLLFIQSWWMWKYPADARMAYLYIIYFAGFAMHILMDLAQVFNTASRDIRFLVYWFNPCGIKGYKDQIMSKLDARIIANAPGSEDRERVGESIFTEDQLRQAGLTHEVIENSVEYRAKVQWVIENVENIMTQQVYDFAAQGLLTAFWLLVFLPVIGQTYHWEYAPKWWGF